MTKSHTAIIRQLSRNVHSWTGVGLPPLFISVSTSGGLFVHHDQIDALLSPQRCVVTGSQAALASALNLHKYDRHHRRPMAVVSPGSSDGSANASAKTLETKRDSSSSSRPSGADRCIVKVNESPE